MNEREPLHVVCCDVLKKELEYLATKNRWNLEVTFLSADLHVSFEKMGGTLVHVMESPIPPNCLMYGACHPMIDRMCADHRVVRTPVQNCIEMLLGKPAFTTALQSGAFFLLEQWALHWDMIADEVFTGLPGLRYEILKEEHNYISCLRTPCSADFLKEAEAVSIQTGLPLEWKDVSLHHMEEVLSRTFEKVVSRR